MIEAVSSVPLWYCIALVFIRVFSLQFTVLVVDMPKLLILDTLKRVRNAVAWKVLFVVDVIITHLSC